MLATLAGFLALLLGLSLLLLPLLLSELSRPRDSAWGAVVLLLGLVLVTSAERLTGAPMLAVLCGGLLVGRLGVEVAQGRWRALTEEERQALGSAERWSRSLHQLAAVVASLLQSALTVTALGSAWLAERRQGRSHGKRWVRSETTDPAAAIASRSQPVQAESAAGGSSKPEPQPAGSQPAEEPAAEVSAVEMQMVEMPTGELQAVAAQTAEAPPPEAPAAETPAAEAPQPHAAPPSSAVTGDVVELLDAALAPQPGGPQDLDAAATAHPGVRVVADFCGVDALLAAAVEPSAGTPASPLPLQAGDAAASPPPQL